MGGESVFSLDSLGSGGHGGGMEEATERIQGRSVSPAQVAWLGEWME